MKIALIYYSDTGNTAQMAEAVGDGIENAGGELETFEVSEFIIDDVEEYDAFAFGCPEFGDGELEESEFEPLFSAISDVLANRPIVLFGSFARGFGDWMDNWEDRCDELGLNLVASGVISKGEPDIDDLEECEFLGEKLVEALSI